MLSDFKCSKCSGELEEGTEVLISQVQEAAEASPVSDTS